MDWGLGAILLLLVSKIIGDIIYGNRSRESSKRERESLQVRITSLEQKYSDAKELWQDEKDFLIEKAKFYVEKARIEERLSKQPTSLYYSQEAFSTILKETPYIFLNIVPDENTIQFLREALSSKDPLMKLHASWVVGVRKIEQLTFDVESLLKEKSEETRLAACDALLKLKKFHIFDSLKNLLQSQDEFIMRNSILLLANAEHEEAFKILKDFFYQSSQTSKEKILSTLAYSRTNHTLNFLETVASESDTLEIRELAVKSTEQLHRNLQQLETQYGR